MRYSASVAHQHAHWQWLDRLSSLDKRNEDNSTKPNTHTHTTHTRKRKTLKYKQRPCSVSNSWPPEEKSLSFARSLALSPFRSTVELHHMQFVQKTENSELNLKIVVRTEEEQTRERERESNDKMIIFNRHTRAKINTYKTSTPRLDNLNMII